MTIPLFISSSFPFFRLFSLDSTLHTVSADCYMQPSVTATPPPSVPCLVNCTLGVCGNGLCEIVANESRSENCLNCPQDCGTCPVCIGVCGNQRCEPITGESACNCPQDCGSCCIDKICSPGENYMNCPSDCSANLFVEAYEKVNSTLVPATITCTSYLSYESGDLLSNVTSTGATVFYGLPLDYPFKCCASAPEYYTNCQTIKLLQNGIFTFNKTARIPLTLKQSSISGTVREFNSKGYLTAANVSCTLGDETVAYLTLSDGTYHLLDLKPGTYNCLAQLPGYSRSTGTVTVQRGDNLKLDFLLQTLNGTFTVFVLDKFTGLGIASNVRCYPYSRGAALPVQTTAGGRVTYTNVIPGQYSCRAGGFKYVPADACVKVAPNSNNFTTITLTPGTGAIYGSVASSNTSLPIVGATIVCSAGPHSVTDTTAVGGKFQFNHLNQDSYSCTVSATGFVSQNIPVTVSWGAKSTPAVSLTPA